MRVCLINNLYKPYARGGAERAVELSARGFAELGHEVSVIAARPAFAPLRPGAPPNASYLPGLYHYWGDLPRFVRPCFHAASMLNPASARRISLLLETKRIDLMLTNNLSGLNMLFARYRRRLCRHIHILHDVQLLHPSGLIYYSREQALDTPAARAYQKMTAFLLSGAEVAVSPSRWLLDLHLERGFFPRAKNAVILNPAVPPETFKRSAEAGRTFTLAYVGLISPAKGIQTLFEAGRILDRQGFRYRLQLAGKNLIGPALDRFLADCPGASYLGELTRSRVAELLSAADVLVMPSICHENSPTVIYEAAMAGLPVVAAAVGGVPELMAKHPEGLFEPGNAAGLARAIRLAGRDSKKTAVNKPFLAPPAPADYARSLLGSLPKA